MSSPSSIAPRERINIVYQSTAEGAADEVELPLKLLVLGDFRGRDDDTPVEHRRPMIVNRHNFNDVMAEADITFSAAVDNRLDEQSAELPVKLRIAGLDDFQPERIAEQVPELNRLLRLRMALVTLKGPLGNIPAFRRSLQELLDDDQARGRVLKELAAIETGEGEA